MSDATNRAPGTCWALRKDFLQWVQTAPGDEIRVRTPGGTLYLDRATARLLAKRINECLDATVKR